MAGVTDSKKKKESKITLIVFIWIGVLVVAILAFTLLGGGSTPAESNSDIIVFNTVVQEPAVDAAPYNFYELTEEDDEDDLIAITGENPILRGLPSGYAVEGGARYVPLDEEGNELTEHTVAGVYINNAAAGNKYVMSYVSASDQMKITSEYEAYNHGLSDPDEKWSTLGEYRCKLFYVRLTAMETSNYYAIFLKNGHFWRIEFNNISQDEVVAAVREVINR